MVFLPDSLIGRRRMAAEKVLAGNVGRLFYSGHTTLATDTDDVIDNKFQTLNA